MPRRQRIDALFNPFGAWIALAAKSGEMLLASQQVIAARTARMANAGLRPTLEDQREFALMGSEKLDAYSRSALGLAAAWTPGTQALLAEATRGWMSLLTGSSMLAASRSPQQAMARHRALVGKLGRHAPTLWHAGNTTARLLDTALTPVHRTATANSKRLARRRPAR